MHLWHFTADASRLPHRARSGERVTLYFGTWPIEPEQLVWVTYRVEHRNRAAEMRRTEAAWQRNEGDNSHWQAEIGPFVKGDRVAYAVYARSPRGCAATTVFSFQVRPKIY